MKEKEKLRIKNPFYFIKAYKNNFLNSDIKIITPNKHITILLQEKASIKNNKIKTHNRLFFNKRNSNNGKLIEKSSTSNLFPPLLNNNNINKKSIELNNIINESEKRLTTTSNNNSYSKDKDKLLSFRLTKSNNHLEDNTNNKENKIKNKKIKILNIKDNFNYNNNDKDECKTTNNFSSYHNNKNVLLSSLKIDSSSINSNKNRTIGKGILRFTRISKNKIKLAKSCEKKKNEFNDDIEEEEEKDEKRGRKLKINRLDEIKLRLRQTRFLSEKKNFKLKYCVYYGNNSKLIDQVMEHRNEIWEKVPTSHYRFCDLIWAPLASTIDFKSCQYVHQCVNHIQYNEEISNKMRLYANLLRHCEKKKIDVYRIFPFTICLTLSHHSFEEQLENFKNLFNDINKYTPKSDINFSSLFNALLNKKIGSIQTINIPKTFNSGKNMWIIKPVNLNRGRCIKVLNDLDLILNEMKCIQTNKKIKLIDGNNNNKININNSIEKDYNNSIKCEYIMIQKYLEKPLLYQGRKFDIRMWVMFMTNRENEVYIFKEGHLKASSLKYNPDSKDLFVHLTNYSVQKHNMYFSSIEIGNEIPFYALQRELDKKKSGKNFKEDIYPKIVRIVRLTGGAAIQGKMNFMNIKNCFEIFGYDFILDENYRPYLLEINTNPGLEISSPLISKLLPRMIDDAFKLIIDEEFTMSNKFSSQESKFPVDYYCNNENLWDRYTIL